MFGNLVYYARRVFVDIIRTKISYWTETASKFRKIKDGSKDAGLAAAAGVIYQAALFRRIEASLCTDAGREGCSKLLPVLLSEFISEYRRLVLHRNVTADPANARSKKRQEPETSAPDLPCEFWFFKQLSRSLRSSLKAYRSLSVPHGLIGLISGHLCAYQACRWDDWSNFKRP